MTGTLSQTARVSTARWNLKEAGGKVPARGTRTAYEAFSVGEEASVSKARCHSEQGCVDAAGIWDEGHASYPGRSAYLPWTKPVERPPDG